MIFFHGKGFFVGSLLDIVDPFQNYRFTTLMPRMDTVKALDNAPGMVLNGVVLLLNVMVLLTFVNITADLL